MCQEAGAMIVTDPAGALEPAREIERCIIMHHQHDWMPRRFSPALRQMRVHHRLPGHRTAVEQPIRRLGSSE
jgi:hypothetical protein